MAWLSIENPARFDAFPRPVMRAPLEMTPELPSRRTGALGYVFAPAASPTSPVRIALPKMLAPFRVKDASPGSRLAWFTPRLEAALAVRIIEAWETVIANRLLSGLTVRF